MLRCTMSMQCQCCAMPCDAVPFLVALSLHVFLGLRLVSMYARAFRTCVCVFLVACLLACLPACLPGCLSVFLSVCSSLCLSVRPSVGRSVCLSLCLCVGVGVFWKLAFAHPCSVDCVVRLRFSTCFTLSTFHTLSRSV